MGLIEMREAILDTIGRGKDVMNFGLDFEDERVFDDITQWDFFREMLNVAQLYYEI